ncbi:hypothetical protein B0J14DRAFT_651822 [Halenospora varia]|nr:hypothetical protein B0J14DRAFT_651822 [Halenospora varia]
MRFFDVLKAFRGPNLEYHGTLACLYTLCSPFEDPEWEDCGMSKYLIRISVGSEPEKYLQEVFNFALYAIGDGFE